MNQVAGPFAELDELIDKWVSVYNKLRMLEIELDNNALLCRAKIEAETTKEDGGNTTKIKRLRGLQEKTETAIIAVRTQREQAERAITDLGGKPEMRCEEEETA